MQLAGVLASCHTFATPPAAVHVALPMYSSNFTSEPAVLVIVTKTLNPEYAPEGRVILNTGTV